MAPLVLIALIGAGAAIVPPVVGAVAGSKKVPDICTTSCKAKCKESNKAIFGGRQKCIKKCEAACYEEAINTGDTPPPPPPLIPSWVSTAGIVILILSGIGLLWLWVSKRTKLKGA